MKDYAELQRKAALQAKLGSRKKKAAKFKELLRRLYLGWEAPSSAEQCALKRKRMFLIPGKRL